MWIGIDFGTTNSAVAFSDGIRVHHFTADRQNPSLLPSLLYISRNFDEYVGTHARDLYLEKNVNAPSLFKPLTVGEITLSVGNESGYVEIDQNVIVMIDVLSPGRLFRSIKTGLRTIEYTGSVIFGTYYTVDELIAMLLKRMVDVASHQMDDPVEKVVMGRPVKFSDDPEIDRRAEEQIRAAAKRVGVNEVTFLPEPIAAAYAYHRDFEEPTQTFIFDFGGGTLDLTVATLGGEKPEILATEGVLIGGDDMDKRILESLLPHFGQGETLEGGRPVPAHVWSSLLDWQTVEDMKRTDTLELIELASKPKQSSAPPKFKALHDLVSKNLYYQLLQEIERVKIALSDDELVTLKMDAEAVQIEEEISRQRFETMINNEVWEIGNAIDRVLEQAGVRADEIDVIVPTGGSSQIPIFRNQLADKFPTAQFATKAERNLTGVVQGLALYGHDLDVQADEFMQTLRPRLFDFVKTQEPMVFAEKTEAEGFSHAVVGIDVEGDIAVVPYRSGKPTEEAKAVYLVNGAFASQKGTILLGTSHGRFMVPQATDLERILQGGSMPFYLQLDREWGEDFVFAQRWLPDNKPLLVYVTRKGNVRRFVQAHVQKPIRESGLWQIDIREFKTDPPSQFISAESRSKICIVSSSGYAIRMNVADISVRGNRALYFTEPIATYACLIDRARFVVVIDERGNASRVDLRRIESVRGNKGSEGTRIARTTVVGIMPFGDDLSARGLTAKGNIIDIDFSPIFGDKIRRVAKLESTDKLIRIWE